MMKQILMPVWSLLLLISGGIVQGQDFSQLFKQSDPAVVVIMTQEKTPVLTRGGGVRHAKAQSGGSEGLGFAASSNMAKALLIDNPPVWLGADFVLLNEELASAFNAGQKHGMLVQKVTAGSIADRLGIHGGVIPGKIGGTDIILGGDIILAINGTQVLGTEQGMRQLIRDFRRVHSGDKLVIRVMRRGAEIVLSATVEIREEQQ